MINQPLTHKPIHCRVQSGTMEAPVNYYFICYVALFMVLHGCGSSVSNFWSLIFSHTHVFLKLLEMDETHEIEQYHWKTMGAV